MANRVWVSGRLTSDIELKRVLLPITNERQKLTGAIINNKRVMPVANFSIAVNRVMQNGQMVCDFIHCTAWGKIAVNIQKYCGKKGMGIEVMGSIRSKTVKLRGGQKIHSQDVWVDMWRYPPSNEGVVREAIEDELPLMGVPIQANTEIENNLPMPPVQPTEPAKEEPQQFEAEPTAPYDYFEDEAEEGNFLPPGM